MTKIPWLFDLDIKALRENLDMKMVINDRMHFCIRLNLKNEREYHTDGEVFGERKERH